MTFFDRNSNHSMSNPNDHNSTADLRDHHFWDHSDQDQLVRPCCHFVAVGVACEQ